jgi:predicted sugar kinase
MLGLSVARALDALHGSPAEDIQQLARAVGLSPDEALETHAFAQGGLLLVDDEGNLRQRQAIAQHDETGDWVFVFVLPRVPPGTPETLEVDRRRALHEAAGYLSLDSGRILAAELWPAVANDDIAACAGALAELRALNDDALGRAGRLVALTAEEQAILEVMSAHGALAWGRCLAGLGLYGLIEGGGPSRELRRALTAHLGYFGGTVMASLCDNEGAKHQIRDA